MSIARKKILMATAMQKGSIAYSQSNEVHKTIQKANPLAAFQMNRSVKPKPVVKQKLTEERKFNLLKDVQFRGLLVQMLENRWRNNLFDTHLRQPELNRYSSDIIKGVKNLRASLLRSFNLIDEDELAYDMATAMDRLVTYFSLKDGPFINGLIDKLEELDRDIDNGTTSNTDKGYFLQKTQSNKPKNKLQEEAVSMIDTLSRKLISDTSVVIQQIKDNLDLLNMKHARCKPLRLDHTTINESDISLQLKADTEVFASLMCYKVM